MRVSGGIAMGVRFGAVAKSNFSLKSLMVG